MSKIIIDKRITFNGFDIVQNVEGDIRLCMNRSMTQIEPINVNKVRRKMCNSKAAEEETQSYRKLAGELM